ncbi:VTT domain-containing protein [Lederbergia sp. NSJ-179]|uniref:DedA family protein n=1 Tax=Lederbergia sp. NSJ-179 TaxID=2931402 RepID=UPI001FD128D8|nr:VTT domain-containing protein [Lederbergia sp. NSJ-179]MCJ7840079.1 VTT domain-containing protein [Lederbergia sp. NSJ-179]
MIQQFLEWLQTIGLPGLFFVMFLEGSSLPFPGLIIVLSYGYILAPGYGSTVFIAIGMSFSYTIASLIPYFLGKKVEVHFPKKFKKGLDKSTAFFKRYGIWSIALSRPFGVGNYISYVAGMSKVHLFKYIVLTFLGIYPWSYIMILLGDYFKGNYQAFQQYFQSYSVYVYLVLGIGITIIGLITYKKVTHRKKDFSRMKEGG